MRYPYAVDQPPCLECGGIHHFRCTSSSMQNSIVGDVCRVILYSDIKLVFSRTKQ